MGRQLRRGRGAFTGDHRHRCPLPRRQRSAPTLRCATGRLRGAARRAAPHQGRRARPVHPWSGIGRQATGGALHRRFAGARIPFQQRASETRRAGHQLSGPLPAHQGQADGVGPARRRVDRGLPGQAGRTARGLPRRLPGVLRPSRGTGEPPHSRGRSRDRPDPGRRNVQLRQGQADREGGERVLPQRHQRDARSRVDLHLRPHRRGGEVPHRVLGAGGGQARADAETEAIGHQDRPGHRRRVRHRQGDRDPTGGRGGVRRDRRPQR
jgi:hypothetical protein